MFQRHFNLIRQIFYLFLDYCKSTKTTWPTTLYSEVSCGLLELFDLISHGWPYALEANTRQELLRWSIKLFRFNLNQKCLTLYISQTPICPQWFGVCFSILWLTSFHVMLAASQTRQAAFRSMFTIKLGVTLCTRSVEDLIFFYLIVCCGSSEAWFHVKKKHFICVKFFIYMNRAATNSFYCGHLYWFIFQLIPNTFLN